MLFTLFISLFAIPEKMDTAHTEIYNRLPEVEDADAAIKQRPDFATFLTDFGSLVRGHGFEDTVGLRLIHKHFTLATTPESQEVMCEDFAQIDETDSLVTQPQKLADVRTKASAASWLFSQEEEETGMPFEYSSDPAIAQARDRIDSAPVFFKEARDMIVGSGYADLLSLAILQRQQILSTGQHQSFLEKSHLEGTLGKSVVQLVDGEQVGATDIRTAWGFGNVQTNWCFYGQYCQRAGQSGHTRVYAHA
jgi:hypothetical protein